MYGSKKTTVKLAREPDWKFWFGLGQLPEGQPIDFLSIDVEGLDMKVLRSNDWQIYQPRVVLVEILDSTLEEIFKNEAYAFLQSQGYLLYAKAVNTIIFKRKY